MCKHKRQQIYGESPVCACGHPDQTVQHLLWTCSLSPPPPIHLEHRRHLPPAQSVSHILPEGADRAEVALWKESCLRQSPFSAPLCMMCLWREEVDVKGHTIGVSEDGTYAFCRKCYITRRARDQKWIWTKRCAHEQAEPRMLGETWMEREHEVTLQMARWKITALRPRVSRSKCLGQAWATSGFREDCNGEG